MNDSPKNSNAIAKERLDRPEAIIFLQSGFALIVERLCAYVVMMPLLMDTYVSGVSDRSCDKKVRLETIPLDLKPRVSICNRTY